MQNSPPTVLHVIPGLHTGGAEHRLAAFVTAKRKQPFSQVIVDLRGSTASDGTLTEAFALRNPGRSVWRAYGARSSYYFIAALRPDPPSPAGSDPELAILRRSRVALGTGIVGSPRHDTAILGNTQLRYESKRVPPRFAVDHQGLRETFRTAGCSGGEFIRWTRRAPRTRLRAAGLPRHSKRHRHAAFFVRTRLLAHVCVPISHCPTTKCSLSMSPASTR